jgi:putative pyruvate formate lyase activating enzyme
VIIRHLVLPGLLAETEQTLEFISTDLSTNVPVSLMSQYFPANEAHLYPELDRKITEREYDLACSLLARYDLREGWLQDPVIDTRPIA